MSLEIPLIANLPSYSFETILDGITFELTVRWNDRDGAWYLHLLDVTGAPVAMGLKLVANWPLLRLVPQDGRRPPGELYLFDTQGTGPAPTRTELGDRYRLNYLTAAEIASG